MERLFRCCIFCFVLIAAFPLNLPAQEKLVTIGFTNPTGAAALPFVMAEKKGFFKKEGVNAVTVTMQNAVVVNGVLSRNLGLQQESNLYL